MKTSEMRRDVPTRRKKDANKTMMMTTMTT